MPAIRYNSHFTIDVVLFHNVPICTVSLPECISSNTGPRSIECQHHYHNNKISKLCKMRSSETHDASIRAKFQLRLASQCKSQTNALTINLSLEDISRCNNSFIFIACCCSKHCCLSRLSHLMDCCSILQYNTRANIKFHIRKIIADTSKYDCKIYNDEYCHCWCINHVVCFS